MSDRRIRKPIFVIACNRSGSTLLFNTVAQHPHVWTSYHETQDIFHRHFPIDLYEGERVGVAASPEKARALANDLYERAHNKERFKDTPLLSHVPRAAFRKPLRLLYRRPPIRLLDKTPANSLRVPLLASVFPDAKYVFLVRRGEDVVSSLIENWTRRTVAKGTPWRYRRWHYLMPPNWVDLIPRPLPEICAAQWTQAVTTAADDFARLGLEHLLVRHEDLLADPAGGYERIRAFCELPASAHFRATVAQKDRVFTEGGSPPEPDKWRRLHSAEIASVRHLIDPVNERYYGQDASRLVHAT